MAKKVAVVTGSNKGIGLELVRVLCKKFDGDVVLTSRDEGRGRQAVAGLEKEGLKPVFHMLDINDHSSIETLRDWLKDTYGGLDLLVNNAGIMLGWSEPIKKTTPPIFDTNYFATIDACDVLFPILKQNARVVNLSSGLSKSSLAKCSESVRRRFVDPQISREELDSLMKAFVTAATGSGDIQGQGFGDNNPYGMSKVGVTSMTVLQQRELDARGRTDVLVNCCCPGWVQTDLGGKSAELTVEEGAEMPAYLALLPADATAPRGCFVQRDSKTKGPKITLWNMDTKHGS